jgi:hypothetical protein
MIGQALSQLKEALNLKADAVQHDFTAVSDQLQALARKISEVSAVEPEAIEALNAEREKLYDRRDALAAEINQWRDLGRAAIRLADDAAAKAFVDELMANPQAAAEAGIVTAAEHVRFMLNASDEELEALEQANRPTEPTTAVGRLLERARTNFDLRGPDREPRRQAAFEFANRPGMLQDEASCTELLATLPAPGETPRDKIILETAVLTLMQIYRLRALRLGELDASAEAVQDLLKLKAYAGLALLPILIEIATTARMGFKQAEAGIVETDNQAVRLLALRSMAGARTPEVQTALRLCQHDRVEAIAAEASRQLSQFPSG